MLTQLHILRLLQMPRNILESQGFTQCLRSYLAMTALVSTIERLRKVIVAYFRSNPA